MSEAKKISTKIWRPILEKLDKKVDAACLRRDAYLSKVLEIEIAMLESEVSIPNSKDALNFISNRLDILDRKLVSLTLDSELVDRLNAICSRKRINRDSFFNRLFLVLAASSKLIDRLFFLNEENWRRYVWEAYKHEGPFFHNSFYPLEQEINPFWAVRCGIELCNEDELVDYTEPESGNSIRVQKSFEGNVYPSTNLYTIIFEDKELKNTDLYGLNTYIPDWQIPGHPAASTYAAGLDDLLAEL